MLIRKILHKHNHWLPVLVGFSLYLSPFFAHGQTMFPGKVAFSNAHFIIQQNFTARIDLAVWNTGDSPQSDVHFEVQLAKKENGRENIVNTFASGFSISLAGQERKNVILNYPIPPSISGNFDLFITANTASGFMLGMTGLSGITLNGRKLMSIMPETCLIYSGTDKHSLSEGVTVSRGAGISIECEVENQTGGTASVRPVFAVYQSSVLGNEIDIPAPSYQALSFASGEKRTLRFSVPVASKPQLYEVTLALTDVATDKYISNKITTHYVISGENATIQNINLDKLSYKKGDTITVNVMWTATKGLSGAVLSVSVSDSGGQICGEKSVSVSNNTSSDYVVVIDAVRDCEDPKANVVILDKGRNILDSRGVVSTVKNLPPPGPYSAQNIGNIAYKFFIDNRLPILVSVAVLTLLFFFSIFR